jgi:hypothetical protein
LNVFSAKLDRALSFQHPFHLHQAPRWYCQWPFPSRQEQVPKQSGYVVKTPSFQTGLDQPNQAKILAKSFPAASLLHLRPHQFTQLCPLHYHLIRTKSHHFKSTPLGSQYLRHLHPLALLAHQICRLSYHSISLGLNMSYFLILCKKFWIRGAETSFLLLFLSAQKGFLVALTKQN